MIVLALDPGLSLGWATNSTSHHRGRSGVFGIDEWVGEWHGPDVAGYSEDDMLARRLAIVRRIVTSTLAHVIQPDLIVVERQLTMRGKRKGCNHDIEKVLIEVAGYLDVMLLRPTPSQWQAWAKRVRPTVFQDWLDGKPDDISAALLVTWALDTYPRMEAA